MASDFTFLMGNKQVMDAYNKLVDKWVTDLSWSYMKVKPKCHQQEKRRG